MGEGQGHQDRLVPVVPGMKPTYKMVGFSQYDGPLMKRARV